MSSGEDRRCRRLPPYSVPNNYIHYFSSAFLPLAGQPQAKQQSEASEPAPRNGIAPKQASSQLSFPIRTSALPSPARLPRHLPSLHSLLASASGLARAKPGLSLQPSFGLGLRPVFHLHPLPLPLLPPTHLTSPHRTFSRPFVPCRSRRQPLTRSALPTRRLCTTPARSCPPRRLADTRPLERDGAVEV